jgi:hypothetical protein
MSRARDLCVLVRSIDIKDISCSDDVKIPIIEFFQKQGAEETESRHHTTSAEPDSRHAAQQLLVRMLSARGFTVRSMGVVWKNGFCIEHSGSDDRAALMVDCLEVTNEEWQAGYRQQKAIERVGWKCMRIGVLSLLTDCSGTLETIVRFLASAGVAPPAFLDDNSIEDTTFDRNVHAQADFGIDENNRREEAADMDPDAAENVEIDPPGRVVPVQEAEDDVVVISSEDEESVDTKPPARSVQPDTVVSGSSAFESDAVEASNYGRAVNLSFLKGVANSEEQPHPAL